MTNVNKEFSPYQGEELGYQCEQQLEIAARGAARAQLESGEHEGSEGSEACEAAIVATVGVDAAAECWEHLAMMHRRRQEPFGARRRSQNLRQGSCDGCLGTAVRARTPKQGCVESNSSNDHGIN